MPVDGPPTGGDNAMRIKAGAERAASGSDTPPVGDVSAGEVPANVLDRVNEAKRRAEEAIRTNRLSGRENAGLMADVAIDAALPVLLREPADTHSQGGLSVHRIPEGAASQEQVEALARAGRYKAPWANEWSECVKFARLIYNAMEAAGWTLVPGEGIPPVAWNLGLRPGDSAPSRSQDES